jgi:hypothetical protein
LGIAQVSSNKVERTHSLFLGPAFDRVGIDHDGPHITVAQKLLDGPDVLVGLEQVAGKAVPLMPSSRMKQAGIYFPRS